MSEIIAELRLVSENCKDPGAHVDWDADSSVFNLDPYELAVVPFKYFAEYINLTSLRSILDSI